ncbi:MAG: cytochrome c biogenesis protein CcdA [Candidatus Woesearchaeota archaeon]
MNPFISYLSGLLAAFTPCVIVLMPLLLYRFFNKEKKQWKSFSFFIIGFLIFYFILSYLLASIFTSQIQNGFKLGLGIMFVVLGILSFMERLNPLDLPLVKNPFIIGVIFAIIAASNPCALPYFSVIVANSASTMFIINIMAFGLGIITPSVLFGLIGQKMTGIAKSSGKFFHSINKLMSLILVVSGAYLALSIKDVLINDIYVVAIMLTLTFVIIIRVFFIINNKKDLLNVKNILLLVSLLLIIFVAVYHCNSILPEKNIHSSGVCSVDVLSCNVCARCVWVFGVAALLGFVGILFIDNFRK